MYLKVKEGYNVRPRYDMDVVFCIDATKSMQPIFSYVKELALSIPQEILRYLERTGRMSGRMRLRVILFRDYMYDEESAMSATDFIEYPEQKDSYERILESIVLDGGGDEPESGLEALAYAMSSDWAQKEPGRKRRQIIIVLTNASTHPLGHGKASPYYDPKMPDSFTTLTEWWGEGPDDTDAKMDYFSKRLLLFAPKADWWTTITDYWENVIHFPKAIDRNTKDQFRDNILQLFFI